MFQVNIWNKICGSRLHACTFHWSHVSNNKKVSYYTFFCFDIWDPSNVLLSQSQSYFSTWITVDTHCITKTYDDVIMTSSSFWVDVIIPRHLIGLFLFQPFFSDSVFHVVNEQFDWLFKKVHSKKFFAHLDSAAPSR